jgi:pimeloyl-ACP methyl ester carboxylesterase
MLLIHGSATDRATWFLQLGSGLRQRFSLWVYDRRGTGSSPAHPDDPPASIAGHAEDAAALARSAGAPVWLVGSSLGAVIALELMRRQPALLRGAVLIEPPLPADDVTAPSGGDFLARFDREVAERGGPAAGELFLRAVLGDEAFARMPAHLRTRSSAMWQEIRADSAALLAYPPRYHQLGEVAVPTLLLGGERSAPYFRPTLDALARALPAAELAMVPDAGHMLHVEAPRAFAALITAFTERVERQARA